MGINYYLYAENGDESGMIELSVVGFIQLKHPDEAEQDLIDWIEFLCDHSGQVIRLMDERGHQTDPAKITGGYVIGLEEYLDGPR